ncbi:hypothetical protein SAMN03159424_03360 [Pseudomonas sp. NFACC05-1]|nr:hypothetical protein [Pseudomonas sp. NFACC05-1]SCW81312.1 hypothetical protein SAMN03159424_03360 [Pseudomonas sp. NFACC05-1]
MLWIFRKESKRCPLNTLPDTLERIYESQLALEAALMEVALWVEQGGSADVGENMRSTLDLIGENVGHIKQGLAKLTLQHRDGA